MKLCILRVCGALFVVGASLTAQAAVVTVTTADDVVDPADGVLSLREAVAGAESGDAVIFDRRLGAVTIALELGALKVKRNLSIEGLGPNKLRIDGNGHDDVFSISAGAGSAHVTLFNMTISGAVHDGITVDGSDPKLTLINCVVEKNMGGGIKLASGSATLINTPVRHNAGFGLVVFPLGTLALTTSPLQNNGKGGARLDGALGTAGLTLIDSNVEQNVGLGIEIARSGDLTMIHSAVQYNTAGGIQAFDPPSSATLVNSAVQYNGGQGISTDAAAKANLVNSVVRGNAADRRADSLDDRSVLDVRSNRILEDSATSTGGGI